jgi:SAM-dependent methyltransferase
LEIGDNAYTVQYGGAAVQQSDVLHVDAASPHATFVGDLSNAPQLPDAAFDCIILTQTLHLIYDFRGALATCYRILKPGGTLLLTAPGLSPIDPHEWQDFWYWSFTDKVLARLMTELLPEAEVTIASFGNVRVATAFLYGMGLGEMSEEELAYQDSQYQVINTVKVVKRGTHS